MARAVGVPAVKPVETKGGCSYLLNPTDVMPSWSISDPTVPPFPPSVDFYYFTDKVGIDALNKDLSDPASRQINDLGAPAAWYESSDPADPLYELEIRAPHGAVRIDVMSTELPQLHPQTEQRIAIAERVYRIAAPRLP